MHPQVVSKQPGRCSICGMMLSPTEGESEVDLPVEEPDAGAASGPDSRVGFSLSPHRVQSIGVTTAPAEYRALHREIRTAGRVAFDPELYAALAEYREVVVERAQMQSHANAGGGSLDRHRALAVRLELLDLSPSQVEQLFEAGADPQSLVLPGRSAWVYGQIFEPATEVRPGQSVRVTAPGLPGRSFRGEIVTVDSDGDATRRSAWVRALVATPGGGLRAESFVRLVIEIPLGRRLAVPEDAILDTGLRQIAIVVGPDGRFEPRDVVVGVEGEGQLEILSGLSSGELVVTAANFLIDSESRFRAAVASLSGTLPTADRVASPASPDDHGAHDARGSNEMHAPHAAPNGHQVRKPVEASNPVHEPGP